MLCGDSVSPSREDLFPLRLGTGCLHDCPAVLCIWISSVNTDRHRIFDLVYHMAPHPSVIKTSHF